MSRRLTIITAISATAAALVVVPGSTHAATKGVELTAHDNGDCTVTFTLVNHTNSTFYQPDWWFDQEGPAPAKTADPSTYVAPWRVVPSTGTTWAFARWVGSPALHSELAPGVPAFAPPTVGYNTSAQPDGKVSTATVDVREATGPEAPDASDAGTQTVWFRIGNGPVPGDRIAPASIVVTGCGPQPWGSTAGSSDGGFGSSIGGVAGLLP